MASGLTVARLMASFITSAPKICAGIEARAPPCLAIGVRTADTITASLFISASTPIPDRSEERRVGKECRARWARDQAKNIREEDKRAAACNKARKDEE